MDTYLSNFVFIMKKEIKLNTIIWVVLIALIVLSSIFAESNLTFSTIIIIAFAVLKFLSVSFQFVEVKHAHIVWKVVIALFVVSYLLICVNL